METVTTRIPAEDEELLSDLEAELGADRSEVLRRLIRDGLGEWRRERALERLRDGSITVRKAAEFAGLSYVEMLSLTREEDVAVGYASEDLDRDLERLP